MGEEGGPVDRNICPLNHIRSCPPPPLIQTGCSPGVVVDGTVAAAKISATEDLGRADAGAIQASLPALTWPSIGRATAVQACL